MDPSLLDTLSVSAQSDIDLREPPPSEWPQWLILILGGVLLICAIVIFVCFWSTIIWAIVEGTRELGPGEQRSFKKTRSSLIVGLCACGAFIVSLGLLLASMYFLGQYWS